MDVVLDVGEWLEWQMVTSGLTIGIERLVGRGGLG